MFMRRSSLPVVVSAASAATTSASHFGREDNSGPAVVNHVGVPSDSDQGRRLVEGPGIPSGDDATSEAVKHDDGGDDGAGNTDHGVGIDIPWDCSRSHERYEMPGGTA